MNNADFAQLFSILAKCKIENNPYLSKEEKEIYKMIADKAKKEIERINTQNK